MFFCRLAHLQRSGRVVDEDNVPAEAAEEHGVDRVNGIETSRRRAVVSYATTAREAGRSEESRSDSKSA